MLTMDDVNIAGLRVLIREDFNVPMQHGKIAHAARIDAALPTIRQAIEKGAKVFLMSHLGRPEEGQYDPAYTLSPVADYLSTCLGQKVALFQLNSPPHLHNGEVALLENVRFLEGEQANTEALGKQLASLCDVFVMDAFAVAHRAQASTVKVAEYAPVACAGPLLQTELKAVSQILEGTQHPIVAIVGGSKVSTKLSLLTQLLNKVDTLVLGGGIANTFLAALHYPIGSSLYEEAYIPIAKTLWQQAKEKHKTIWLPEDVVVAQAIEDKIGTVKMRDEVAPLDKIFDIGPRSQESLSQYLLQAKTILWNGPVGVFEQAPFRAGTKALAEAIAKSDAYSVAGGGDTLAAIECFKVAKGISYLSTGGGAFLEALEGKPLPGIICLGTK